MRIASEPIIDLLLENLNLWQQLDLFRHLREELGLEINAASPDWHFEVLKRHDREVNSTHVEAVWTPLEDALKSLKSRIQAAKNDDATTCAPDSANPALLSQLQNPGNRAIPGPCLWCQEAGMPSLR